MKYMALFDENGNRKATYPIDVSMTAKKRQALEMEGYIEITESDWNYYVGNMGEGDNGTGYIRDPETGKPVSAPAYIPTKNELANKLFNECQSDLELIDAQIMNAIVIKDNELIEDLRQERAERVEQYQNELEALGEGE